MLTNSRQEYGAVAKTLHWLIFLLVLGLVPLGLIMTELPREPATFRLYNLHKAFGLTLFALVIVRLAWKLGNANPAPLDGISAFERRASAIVHWAFYFVLLAMPLLGWLGSSAAGAPVSWFGVIELPALTTRNPDVAAATLAAHRTLAFVLLGLLALHVAGALKHQLFDRLNAFGRITPARKTSDRRIPVATPVAEESSPASRR